MRETYGHRRRRLRRTQAVQAAIEEMKHAVTAAITGSSEIEDIDAMYEDIRGLLADHVADVMHSLNKADDDPYRDPLR